MHGIGFLMMELKNQIELLYLEYINEMVIYPMKYIAILQLSCFFWY